MRSVSADSPTTVKWASVKVGARGLTGGLREKANPSLGTPITLSSLPLPLASWKAATA